MSLITTEVRDRVGILTLNDPDHRNAITLAMNDEIGAVLDDWEVDDGIGALVLTGAGRGFCAGADLDDLMAGSNAAEMKAIYDGFLRIAHTPLPTVGAVNGAAVGAGMNMVLACDIAIAGRDYAKFDSRFLQIGIHPGGGHTWRLRSIANRSTTMAMVVFNQILRADRAKDVGLIWEVVDDADLIDEAVALAAVAAGQAKELNARTKASILTLDTIVESNQAVDHEVHPQLWSMSQPTFRTLVESLQKNISSKE
ncbi:MAG: enoyl-CoA hydratase [Acidimicrobiaceae bacterium]|jgi:enoyl-CoA hydratase|nr:enoyl-CoA hydratase [Acidimicrobiaceae bacterium]MBT5580726.1 enoyl-CoA hydratase [Acidimicrobiaceae bacterium]MBT5851632.1 enoyl-CoA hydratase [Acidimicrobiaceae bacterium]